MAYISYLVYWITWQVRSLTIFHGRCSQVSLVSIFVKFKGIPSNPNLICSIMTSLRGRDIQCSSLYLCDSDLFHLISFHNYTFTFWNTVCNLCLYPLLSVLSANEFLPAVPCAHLLLDLLSSWSFLFGSKMLLFSKVNFCFSSYRFLYSYWRSAPRMFSMEETAGLENLCICDNWSYILNFYIIKVTLNEKSNCKKVCKHGITNIKSSW